MILLVEFTRNNRIQSYVTMYTMGFSLILLPLWWIRRRYQQHLSVFGLHRGNWAITKSITTGVIGGLAYYTVFALVSGQWINLKADNLVHIIVLPLSIGGFPLVVLGPIGQELFFRGFLYNYFQTKLGVVPALVLQSLIFTISHVSHIYFFDNKSLLVLSFFFIYGIIAGILYRVSNSIYPSIVFHGIYNYLTLAALFSNRVSM